MPLTATLAELLAPSLDSARAVVEAAVEHAVDGVPAAQGAVLAPVDRQEVWAAGVHLPAQPGRPGGGVLPRLDVRPLHDAERPEVLFVVDRLFRGLDFPAGVVLLTGTGPVPGSDFTLREGDTVTVGVEGVGTLTNPVVVVGR